MSIRVTDEMVDEFFSAFNQAGGWRFDTRGEKMVAAIRASLTAALAVAPKSEPSGNPGELRDAIRAAVLKEREACADTALAVAANNYLVSDGEAGRMGFRAGCKEIASAIRSRPDPSEAQ